VTERLADKNPARKTPPPCGNLVCRRIKNYESRTKKKKRRSFQTTFAFLKFSAGGKLNRTGHKLNRAGGKLNHAGGKLNRAGGKLSRAGGKLSRAGGKLSRAGGKLNRTGHKLNRSVPIVFNHRPNRNSSTRTPQTPTTSKIPRTAESLFKTLRLWIVNRLSLLFDKPLISFFEGFFSTFKI